MALELERKVAAALTDNLHETVVEGWTYMDMEGICSALKAGKQPLCDCARRSWCRKYRKCGEFNTSLNIPSSGKVYQECRKLRLTTTWLVEPPTKRKASK